MSPGWCREPECVVVVVVWGLNPELRMILSARGFGV